MRLFSAVLACWCALDWAPPAVAQDSSPETKIGEAGFESPAATLAQMDWLVGQWSGEGIGGAPAMESWLPPSGGTMVGSFVQTTQGEGGAEAILFTEHMYLSEQDGSLVVKLKHFNADLTGWEDKEGMVTFRLLALEPCAAYFQALTYRCTTPEEGEGGLVVAVRMKSDKPEVQELKFRFDRATPTPAVRAPCKGANDREIDACSAKLAREAEARRQLYREAALERFADQPRLTAEIRASEAAFDTYRERECKAQGEHWDFMRQLRQTGCYRRLTDQRTRTIWTDWLYSTLEFNSGLPEPQQAN